MAQEVTPYERDDVVDRGFIRGEAVQHQTAIVNVAILEQLLLLGLFTTEEEHVHLSILGEALVDHLVDLVKYNVNRMRHILP
jgi:hypothetical protein